MKTLRDFNFYNKRVLVRADFNVSFGDDGRVDDKEDWRLKATLPTINYLLNQKAKIILLSHLGRPDGRAVEELRMDPIGQRISQLIGQPVKKLDNCIGPEVEQAIKKMEAGQVVLLENVQFHSGEKENSPAYIESLANLADFFVMDAFGQAHRDYASISGLPKRLPGCAGLLLEKEVKVLSEILEKPKCPLVVIIGGVKISTKIKMIEHFLEKADSLILGGALANIVIRAKGLAIGRSIIEEEMVEEAQKMELTNIKLHLPVDVIVSVDSGGEASSRIAPVGNISDQEMILDIGPDTIELFKRIISGAEMIVWNGPMGLFETEKFAAGTKAIAEAIAQGQAFSLVGGGDTINCLNQLGLLDKIDHISTGGGAMLKFLSGEKLPGIEALKITNIEQ
ncbi:MAG: phosphoglycerate kinase [Candidatus Portnoybacteria bacterium RIFCSPLOWO2_12_FULL_39_9]|uniref:Phosphoglycerate kinase n=1 Tax=Candidatus Portnoybacteria bacterium RIFCSPHIGHO2_12_FULL_38_9 TaxID=1801997 RepID=A0A1G2FFA3_9BACT|nr:MAG: phosphoglycerate kinase [Candidatus Portnoybacteria bacterium RBG_13_40_8]OGZ36069.1 MAG: phosphoglycerate kinase [Candidatus Portnoybacteria bacterium RIFCSPHIGHO2_02_FULL_39_12]OGZ36756.1 MAG: phosphoglycerate kinase [Candidatus Portnoybacteria bacterium RIFCSPHIGHO2_12_FULL_38_9]OGZ38740.1 MAG: phosphoglycerate kinase [Candidatus Portnoybacteria bacterium RIFCSPLOWO2_01_FULL_38_39]OGZ40608.1 MAG: phosphoglycerate kinase [Candidatus Portnoybacteria bacterium RIFCSPLOWO2_12_FULL_39_9]